MTLQSIGSVFAGAGVTAAAGVSGALTSHLIIPNEALTLAIGIITAVAAAMAWVDKRIDKRFVDHDVLEGARAAARDEALLRKVEEMLNR